MSNPLLQTHELPPFSKILPEHIKPAVEEIISDNETVIDALLAEKQSFNWKNLQEVLDKLDDRLSQSWSPVGHMNAVVNSDELRDAYNSCLPILSEYSTRIGQNHELYQAYQSIADSKDFAELDNAQKKVINDTLRDLSLIHI